MHTKVERIQLTLHDLQSQHSSSWLRRAQASGSEELGKHWMQTPMGEHVLWILLKKPQQIQ